jgi:hypothetical protein
MKMMMEMLDSMIDDHPNVISETQTTPQKMLKEGRRMT